jgi:hypothetical protein
VRPVHINPEDTCDLDELTTAAAHAQDCLEVLHVVGYFAPECRDAHTALGLHPLLCYFPARAAALGAAGAELTTATFYVFAPRLVEAALPSSWDVAGPEQVQATRRVGVAAALQRLLGTPEVDEALALARTACEGLSPQGRSLYAAHTSLTWPEEPLLALWHAATLLREHRGDGHLAALVVAGLDPVEAIVLNGITQGSTGFMKATRGWTEQEWAAGVLRLTGKGLLLDESTLSPAGAALKQSVEDQTAKASLPGWAHLGVQGTERLAELTRPLRDTLLASDLFPGFITRRART